MPFKEDKPKDAKNSMFEASLVLVAEAIHLISTAEPGIEKGVGERPFRKNKIY